MKALDRNNEIVSMATYEAFTFFILNILPKYLELGIKLGLKTLYLPVYSTDQGVYIGKDNFGKINFLEFISYFYELNSFKGFKNYFLKKEMITLPLDLKTLIYNYYEELQRDEYEITGPKNIATNIESFKKEIIPELIEDAIEGNLEVSTVYKEDNSINILYVPVELRNKNLYIGNYDIGIVDTLSFLEALKNIPGYISFNNNGETANLCFLIEDLLLNYQKSLNR